MEHPNPSIKPVFSQKADTTAMIDCDLKALSHLFLIKRLNLLVSILIGIFLFCQANCMFAQTAKEDAFKSFLSTNVPIKRLRFTVISCASGNQRKFIAAVDNENFFIREYSVDENPTELINTNNRPKHITYGRNGNEYWQISRLEITKTSATDGKVNAYQLNAQAFKYIINNVLTLGVPNVKPGSFVWKRRSKDGTKQIFEAVFNDNLRVQNSKGEKVPMLSGYILLADGVVSQLNGFGKVNYEYPANLPIPEGIPSKILMGTSTSDCDNIYSIEELVYGDGNDSAELFSPENKFVSTNIISIVLVANDTLKVLSPGLPILPAVPPQAPVKHILAMRLMISLLILILLVIVVFFINTQKVRKNQ